MATTNRDIANILLRLADALRLTNSKEDQFKIRSYQKAAQVLHNYPNDCRLNKALMSEDLW